MLRPENASNSQREEKQNASHRCSRCWRHFGNEIERQESEQGNSQLSQRNCQRFVLPALMTCALRLGFSWAVHWIFKWEDPIKIFANQFQQMKPFCLDCSALQSKFSQRPSQGRHEDLRRASQAREERKRVFSSYWGKFEVRQREQQKRQI